MTRPELYIIGAGPGDPELITMKGYRLLRQAKAVLYDNLANKELLAVTPAGCEKIYVGKQPYGKYTPQETIHALIREKAFEHGSVIRLKGGDPFIFGRGFEEMLYARAEGIDAYYVPGITSMQASGMENVPLTHRSVSESVWMVTGTKKDGSLSDDLRLAIQSRATVVIYMGMKKLAEISETYLSSGNGEMPAAIVQHASLPNKKFISGKVKDLPAMATASKLTHPALIIIGRVVELHFSGESKE
ncbi:uroporphyrinogen-III C-methyltransferase [Hufsiella ginkgonis]|uniref:uroporphyrinogen-III C-methyltransferase n=1 Tax=Hufsiella ginkgonis TaxID=2695274 RepID=A0A7K1XZQ0_9SPHI|nr:uroporphyrinogen-III C-methyltransferase [Hufsiella ginkgonis]MXV16297.1 uroporphyrinogen-III C-methyltransferase [Hufsiella ginkgonis]